MEPSHARHDSEAYGARSYGDAFADVYDEWYAGLPDTDVAVAALARLGAGGSVLELGVGTGRLALPLAASGLDVWGIDASLAMIERLRAKPGAAALTVVAGDMAALPFRLGAGGGRFRLVVVALNALFNLVTRQAQEECLARVASLLEPGGRLVVEAFVPAGDPARTDAVVERAQVESTGPVLTVTRHEPMEQIVEGHHVELAADGIRLRRWRLRYAPPAELDAMAAAAGLSLADRWGGWRGERFDEDSALHVSVYVGR